ncbi:MAG TPA: hypothetical protein PLI57_05395 [Spirochaetota bacterium]|nr:hypothetical protein [Spirochaetota bacterium]
MCQFFIEERRATIVARYRRDSYVSISLSKKPTGAKTMTVYKKNSA